MTEKYQEDGETFTKDWQFQLLTHPVIMVISAPLISDYKKERIKSLIQNSNEEIILEELLTNLVIAAEKFFEFGDRVYEEIEKVQDGLNIVTSMLFQFLPSLEENHDRKTLYGKVNSIFWGNFFYFNGLKHANETNTNDEFSSWQMARLYAYKNWKLGEEEFGWSINHGVKYVEEKIKNLTFEPTEKLEKLNQFMDRFEFSEQYKLGFMFFIGGSLICPKNIDEISSLRKARDELSVFDVNFEVHDLMNFRDLYIKNIMEEFIWRSDTILNPRKVNIPGTDKFTSSYNFENHKILLDSDLKIEKFFDADSCFHEMFEKIGEELLSQHYDLRKSYKAGLCFANIQALVDAKCTQEIYSSIRTLFTPILSVLENFARSIDINEDYLDVQISLVGFLGNLDLEFCKTFWVFQSCVFFSNQKEIDGVHALSIEEFKEHCRKRAIYYFNSEDKILLKAIAEKGVHMSMFPQFETGVDERNSFEMAFVDTFGSPKNKSYVTEIHLKTLIIFSYFNVVCETMLKTNRETTLQ